MKVLPFRPTWRDAAARAVRAVSVRVRGGLDAGAKGGHGPSRRRCFDVRCLGLCARSVSRSALFHGVRVPREQRVPVHVLVWCGRRRQHFGGVRLLSIGIDVYVL